MQEMILKTLTSEGQMSAGQIAELIGEDAEAVKIELEGMIAWGVIVKNGLHRYQVNTKHPHCAPDNQPVILQKTKAVYAEVEKHVAAAQELDAAQSVGSKTIADVLDEMRRRLKNSPHKVENLNEKLKALTRLYEMVDEPLKSLIMDVMSDLEMINKNG